MKRVGARPWFAVLVVALGGVVAAGGLGGGCRKPAGTTRAHVIQVTPGQPEVTRAQMSDGIRVTFDRAAAPPDAAGRVITGPAFLITPPLPGEARWLDERTLVFFPTPGALRAGQAYAVTLADGVVLGPGLALDKWTGTRLVYDRIQLERARLEGTPEFQPLSPEVALLASHPVAADAARGCVFAEKRPDGSLGKSTVAVALPRPSPPDGEVPEEADQARTRRLRVRPEAPLKRGTAYVFRCGEQFRSAGGGEGLLEPHEEAFATYGDPGIKAIAPTGKQEIPADQVEVKIEFATPMPADEVRRRVTLKTAAGKAVPFAIAGDYRGAVFEWSGDLEPNTEYRLNIAKGLVDRFDQPLDGAHQHTFKVGNAGPGLQVTTGIFVLEREPGRLPIATRNLPQIALTCATVPEGRLAGVLDYTGDYQRFRASEAGENKHPIPWTQLGLQARPNTLRPEGTVNRWKKETLDLAALCGAGEAAGTAKLGSAYLLEFGSEGERERGKVQPRWRRALVSVTDLGLVAKMGNASSLLWVVRLSTGTPVAGASIKLRDPTGKVRFSGTSGPDGLLQGPAAAALLPAPKPAARPDAGPGDDDGESDGEDGDEGGGGDDDEGRSVVTAQAGEDLAVLDTRWIEGLYAWSFGLTPDRNPAPTRIRGFIHSDRGLYRPGDTVHLRGLLRAVDRAGRMTVPRPRQARQSVRLQIEDPRGANLLSVDLPLSAFGSFNRDLVLAAEARLGDYRVKASGPGFTVRDGFSVEEYRPRSFEVGVKTARKDLFLGKRLVFDVTGNYLYGAPLRGGKVTWTVRRRPHRAVFSDFADYVFQDLVSRYDEGSYWARDEDRSFSESVSDGEGTLDAAGKAHVSSRDTMVEAPTAQDYLFEASVEDASGQAVSATSVVTGHRANLYLGLLPAEMVQSAGKPFTVKVVGVDVEGKRRAASAKLSLTRRRFECGHQNGGDWRCKRTVDPRPAVVQEVAVPATGDPVIAEVTVAEPGQYQLRIEAPDGRGATAVSSDLIWVAGKGEGLFDDEGEGRMPLVTSKTRYQPGDVARIIPQADLTGAQVLVTVERDGVLSHRVLSALETGSAIEVPIEGRLAPNAFVSVTLVRPASVDGKGRPRPRFQMGMAALEVDAAAKRLQVVVETERARYEPGETVKGSVKVLTAEGRPVKAELAVAAADEGVLQILGFRTPDPQPAFYAPWDLGVQSATTWLRILDTSKSKEDEDRGGGDAGGSEAGRVRSRFMATAFWQPALVTRADGTGEVSFPAPDNLTAFRLMAVAADAGDRFGAGEVRFTVAKSLQASPALPRFLTVGDSARPAVLVQNNTTAPQSVEVTLTASGVELVDASPQKVEVAAGVSRRVEFAAVARAEGQARFRFRATAGPLSDAVDTTIAVERPVVPETLVLGEGTSATPVTLALPAASAGGVGGGTLEVVLDRTGMAQLDESLRYLVGYPYGCLEQVTSKVVPMVALRELSKDAGTTSIAGVPAGQVDSYVRAGVARMLLLQRDDGGFALWPGASSELHTSAYALWGLRVAAKAGVAVDARVWRDGASYLQSHLDDEPRPGASAAQVAGQAAARAFAHLVLADLGKTEAAPLAQLFADRRLLPIYGRAFLLSALAKAGRKSEAATLARELGALAPAGDGPVVLSEPSEFAALDWYWSTNLRTTALVLLALQEASPAEPVIARLGQGLLAARVAGRWSTTQENAYALVALAVLARQRATVGESRVTVVVAGQAQPVRVLRGGAVERLSLPLASLGRNKEAPLLLNIAGGQVSYSARLHVQRPLGAAASDRGLALRRQYLDAETGAVLQRMKLGQAVRVRLTVSAAGRQAHVALVDRLPAGLEPMITRFSPTGRDSDDGEPHGSSWHDLQTSWQHRELRDDGAQIFADVLAPGESRQEYLARATSVGSFAAPPATAEAMYKPAINGRSAAATVIVER